MKRDWKNFYSENLEQYVKYEGTGHNRIARDFFDQEIGSSEDRHFHQLVLVDLNNDGQEEALASISSFDDIHEYFYDSHIDQECVDQYEESEQDAPDLNGCIIENKRDYAYSYLVFFPEESAQSNQILNMVRHEGEEVVACERCSNMPERYEVIEIEDVNEDGILDVITGAYYQEGETIDLYMLKDGRLELVSSYSYGVKLCYNDGMKIVYFEDTPRFAVMYKTALEKAGFEVVHFEQPPPDVVEILAREKPDLILTDIMMPGIDGFQMAELVKEDERTRHIPVFGLSSMAFEDYRQRGLGIGMEDYLFKNENPPERLAAKVSDFIEKKKP